jgi:hypothetical protein
MDAALGTVVVLGEPLLDVLEVLAKVGVRRLEVGGLTDQVRRQIRMDSQLGQANVSWIA